MHSLNRYSQLWQLILAHFREIIREPGVLFWGILFPILMSLGLGVAFTNKSESIRKVAITTSSDLSVIDSILKSVVQKPVQPDKTGNHIDNAF